MEISDRADAAFADGGKSIGSAVIGRTAGSKADLFPRLLAMQRNCDASGFAVCSSEPATLMEPGRLSLVMESAGSKTAADARVADLGPVLVEHLMRSPLPVIFHPHGLVFTGIAALFLPMGDADGITIAFPAPLGSKGSGYVILFGVAPGISPEQMIDLHRKSISVMRELLKMEFASVPALDTLNEREVECLQLVGNGMKSEAIGERLNLSVHTVNAYLSSATAKLDAVNRIQAITKAIRLGLIA